MPERIAEQGDTISGYAREYGVPAKKIWSHERNAELKARREHNNILHPGDVVYIPEPEPKQCSGETDKLHRFVKPGSLEISVAVLDLYHKPISGVEYHFVIDGKKSDNKKTGGDGIARTPLPDEWSEAVLHLPWGAFPMEVGWLDPTRTIKGIQKRLRNLGIDPGPIDGILGPKTARAIREFQLVEAAAGLKPNGIPDEATIKRLRDVHDQMQLEGVHNSIEDHAPEPAGKLDDSELDSEPFVLADQYDDLGAAEDLSEPAAPQSEESENSEE